MAWTQKIFDGGEGGGSYLGWVDETGAPAIWSVAGSGGGEGGAPLAEGMWGVGATAQNNPNTARQAELAALLQGATPFSANVTNSLGWGEPFFRDASGKYIIPASQKTDPYSGFDSIVPWSYGSGNAASQAVVDPAYQLAKLTGVPGYEYGYLSDTAPQVNYYDTADKGNLWKDGLSQLATFAAIAASAGAASGLAGGAAGAGAGVGAGAGGASLGTSIGTGLGAGIGGAGLGGGVSAALGGLIGAGVGGAAAASNSGGGMWDDIFSQGFDFGDIGNQISGFDAAGNVSTAGNLQNYIGQIQNLAQQTGISPSNVLKMLQGSGGNAGGLLGGLLGALAGGLGANSKPAGNITSIQDIPDYLKPYQSMNLASGVNNFANAGAGAALLPGAQQQLQNTIAGQYLDPNTNPAFQPYVKDLMGQAGANFASLYGKSPDNLNNSAFQENYTRAITNAALPLYNSAYQTERANQMNAATNAPAFASNYAGAALAPNLAFKNLYTGPQATTQPYFTNPTAGALSGGLAGYTLGNSIFGSR